jgi:phospholipid transport system transporter-binding protein
MASSLTLEARDGRLSLSGELDPAGVTLALAQSRGWLAAGTGTLQVDLAGVTRSESAGIALLLEWLREARRRGRDIEFHNPPAQMRSMLKFFDLEQMLPIRA